MNDAMNTERAHSQFSEPMMRCVWANNCGLEFGDAEEYRRHCAAHVKSSIEAALAQHKIHLPVETWTEVLPSCDWESLAQRVSLSRRLFQAIARPLIDGPKGRFLPEMAFMRIEGTETVLAKRVPIGDGNCRLVELPVAEVPPPKTVVGFPVIALNCFDAKVLSFLWAIRHLLNDVRLDLDTESFGRFKFLKPVVQQHYKKYQWQYGSEYQNFAVLECLLRVFPRMSITFVRIHSWADVIGAELLACLLVNVRHLRMDGSRTPPPPELPSITGSYSHNCSPHIPVLVKWMHSPREDGHQKMASLNIGRIENLAVLVEQAQEHFLSATSTPVSYFVAFHSSAFSDAPRIELPFTRIHNEHTGEVLSLRYYPQPLTLDYIPHNFVLFRRRSVSAPTAEEEDEEAELLAMRGTFGRTLFTNESRNRLALDIAWMSEVDESLFPADSEDGLAEDKADGSEPGPSSAKKIKTESAKNKFGTETLF